MINTVPKGVTLTDPIPLIEYKVGKVRLFPSNDSDTLKLTTTLRVSIEFDRAFKLLRIEIDPRYKPKPYDNPSLGGP